MFDADRIAALRARRSAWEAAVDRSGAERPGLCSAINPSRRPSLVLVSQPAEYRAADDWA